MNDQSTNSTPPLSSAGRGKTKIYFHCNTCNAHCGKTEIIIASGAQDWKTQAAQLAPHEAKHHRSKGHDVVIELGAR